jgi:hypothetical protein
LSRHGSRVTGALPFIISLLLKVLGPWRHGTVHLKAHVPK